MIDFWKTGDSDTGGVKLKVIGVERMLALLVHR